MFMLTTNQIIILHPSRILTFLEFFSHLTNRAGHLLRTLTTPFHLTNGCSSGGGSPAPCTCPPSLASTCTVSGFGALTACPTCDPSSDTNWDGKLYQSGEACLWWALTPDFNPYNINGHSLDISYTQLLLNSTVSPCRWELYIACTSLTHPTQTMWSGHKTTGTTPIGLYTLTSSDCGNTTPTMTVS